jgi:hypothetical protein
MVALNSSSGEAREWLETATASGVVDDLAALHFWTVSTCQGPRRMERGRERPERRAGILHLADYQRNSVADVRFSGEQSLLSGDVFHSDCSGEAERRDGGLRRATKQSGCGFWGAGRVGCAPVPVEGEGRLEEEEYDRRARGGSGREGKGCGFATRAGLLGRCLVPSQLDCSPFIFFFFFTF